MKNSFAVIIAAVALVTVSQSAFAGRYSKPVRCATRACTTANRKTGCCKDIRDKAGKCFKIINTAKCAK